MSRNKFYNTNNVHSNRVRSVAYSEHATKFYPNDEFQGNNKFTPFQLL